MSATLRVPESLAERVRSFVANEGLSLEVVTDADGVVAVVESGHGHESTATTIHAGGWIACQTAFHVAGKLGIPTLHVGKLLNHLDVRIRACQLGCFE